jgi:hypothetical protein
MLVELIQIAVYPIAMKKLICILLIGWLPVFMVAANAMSLQMTTKVMNDDVQVQSSMPCHDEVDDAPVKSHNCISCGLCVVTTSVTFTSVSPVLHIPAFKSFKLSFVDDAFKSIYHAPAYRPPILN